MSAIIIALQKIYVNTLRLGQNDHQFTDNIFQ